MIFFFSKILDTMSKLFTTEFLNYISAFSIREKNNFTNSWSTVAAMHQLDNFVREQHAYIDR